MRSDLAWCQDALEEILTGRSYDDVYADPRQAALIGPARPEEIDGGAVLSVTDTLRDALATMDPSAVAQVARRWAVAEDAADAEEGLTQFLVAFADLARQAVGRAEHLYCLVCF